MGYDEVAPPVSLTPSKISGSTRSEAGRRCRDTFASLKKTCRKLGVSFWAYLRDRVRGLGQVPRLADLIRKKAQADRGGMGPAAALSGTRRRVPSGAAEAIDTSGRPK